MMVENKLVVEDARKMRFNAACSNYSLTATTHAMYAVIKPSDSEKKTTQLRPYSQQSSVACRLAGDSKWQTSRGRELGSCSLGRLRGWGRGVSSP